MNAQLRIRQLMQAELVETKTKNPAYSMRAFSRRIGLYSSTTSEILSGKRRVTRKMADRILKGLGTAPDEARAILESFGGKNNRSKTDEAGSQAEFVQVNMDQFHVVSDWQYFAILSLADTRGFRDDPEWVARRLGISPQDARVALERLERLGMLVRGANGKLGASGLQFTTSADIANLSLRKHHYQNLELARKSLDRDDVLEREFTFINMAVDPKKLPEVKKRIRSFRNELCEYFESGPREEVYKMCIQLFPLTKREE